MTIINLRAAILICLYFFSASCFYNQSTPDETVPDAFRNKSAIDLDLTYERKTTNIIDKLFKEYLETNPVLKNYIQKFDDLNFKYLKDIHSYNYFNENNVLYYSTAHELANSFTDSVFAQVLINELEKSEAKYLQLTQNHFNILTQINSEKLSINDLISAIKILRTIEIIENYQNNNLPALDTIQKDYNEYLFIKREISNQFTKDTIVP